MLRDGFLPKWTTLSHGGNGFFQQDGAPPHYALIVMEFFNAYFEDRWIGRGVTESISLAWSARNPDLTPLEFSLWGYIKGIVYSQRSDSLPVLQTRNLAVFETMKGNLTYLAHTIMSIPKRYKECIRLCGKQVV